MKQLITFRERSARELERSSFEVTRGPSAQRTLRKPKSTLSRPKKPLKALMGQQPLAETRSCIAPAKSMYGIPEEEWQAYFSLVLEGHVRFLQLDCRTWLAEQYDLETDERYEDFPEDIRRGFMKWTQVSAAVENHNQVLACSDCPQYKTYGKCVHTLLVKNQALEFVQWSPISDPPVLVFHYDWYDQSILAASPDLSSAQTTDSCIDTDNLVDGIPSEDPPVQLDVRTYRALFTVSERVRQTTRRGRVTVRFVGRAIQSPLAWNCQRCPKDERCSHILSAQQRLRDLVLAPEEADGEEPFAPQQFHPLAEYRQLQPHLERHGERCVSYRPLPPVPLGRSREGRTMFDINYESLRLLRLQPAGDQSDENELPNCRCGTHADDLRTMETRACTIYDMDRAYSTQIEVFRCQTCNKYSAGPDLGNIGLFNFDNKTLATHRLLHKYDAYYSLQEGTFAAFSELLNYEYDAKLSVPNTFMHVDVFRTVWFSFVRLQQFSDSMICPICREQPHAIIADGVTVATRMEKATGNIQPPTVPHDAAPVRDAVRPATRIGGTQLVPFRQLRKRRIDLIDCVRPADMPETRTRRRRKLVVRGQGNWELVPEADQETDDLDEVLAYVDLMHAAPGRGRVARTEWSIEDLVGDAAKALLEQDSRQEALADAFQLFVLSPEGSFRNSWLRLLKQIFCEESALQVVSFNCIAILDLFATWHPDGDDDKQSTLYGLVEEMRTMFPYFGVVVSECVESYGNVDLQRLRFVQDFARWLHVRTHEVYIDLERHQSDDGQPPSDQIGQPDWTLTGQCYSRPQIRYRPRYPGLRTDGTYERNVIPSTENFHEDVMCSKYYAMYGRRGYTGGLLALWCTHGVCYGFHVIPQGEGRNDVFSAIYTRFKVAPKVVIYDFACALGPYCMLREAEYWRDTLFVIDRFHASGHKTCSAACMLSTYAEHSSTLRALNSSVAEMGNSMLRYVRKSIRYMTEGHAILYVHRFLSIWNQRVKQKLAEKRPDVTT